MSESEWVETTLGDVATITIGRTPPSKNPVYWTDDLSRPFCTIADMIGRSLDPKRQGVTAVAESEGKAKRVPKGALLMSFKLSIGRVGFASRDVFPNEAIAWLRSTTETLDEQFLALVLESQDLSEGSGRAVKGSTLNGKSLRAIRVFYPPLPEQRRIIEVMSAVDVQIGALEAEHAALNLAYIDALSLLWTDESGDQADLRRLSDLMTIDVDRVKVDATGTYSIAGVLNAGKGLISRGTILGSDTDYGTLNKMRTGQVVMRKLTAWEGPISVVTDEFDGYFASAEFPTFSLTPGLSARYFDHVCRTQRLLDEMKNRVTGTVQRRKRLNPDQLLDVRLPVPPLPRQEIVADALDAMYDGLAFLRAELAALRCVRSDLLTALLSQDITVDEAVDQFMEGAA